MMELPRNGSERAFQAFISFLLHQVKRMVINLLYTIVVVIGISAILVCALWVTTKKMNSSPMSPDQEITIQNEWSHSVLQILKDVLLYVANLLTIYEPLTVGNLLQHRDLLGRENSILRRCFDRAIVDFSHEPHSVKQNARMVIHCDRQAIKFRSGNGDCEILVYFLEEQIQYVVHEQTSEMYLIRLSAGKEPLSTGNLLKVKNRLQTWKILSHQMEFCMDFAVQEFAKEPFCVQDDAHMVIDCDGHVLQFTSGSGRNEINVRSARDGNIHYQLTSCGLWAQFVRFLGGNKNHVLSGADTFPQLE